MNPFLSNEMAQQHIRDLRRAAQAARTRRDAGQSGAESLTVRALDTSDAKALASLAELDSAGTPSGPVLGAVVGGRLLAALPLDGGRAVADPFTHTSDLVALLELRARQLQRHDDRALVARLRRVVAASPRAA